MRRRHRGGCLRADFLRQCRLVSDRGHRAHLDRDVVAAPLRCCRCRSISDLGAVPVAAAAAAPADVAAATGGDCGRVSGVRRRAESALTLGGHQLCFFVIAMACHGELARTRPAARYLTGFYVALSFGGMVGGLFAGLVAPFAFSWVAEYPILLTLATLCRPAGDERLARFTKWYWPLLAAIAVAFLLPAYYAGKIFSGWRITVSGSSAVSVCLRRCWRWSSTAAAGRYSQLLRWRWCCCAPIPATTVGGDGCAASSACTRSW